MEMGETRKLGVIEDDDGVRESLALMLVASGYEVEAYATGDQFLSSCSRELSCLLMDVQMPGRSGLQVLEELKSANALPPTIMLTGQGSIAIAVEAMKLGAIDFLEKPYEPRHLLDAVERALNTGADHPTADAAVIEQLSPRQRDVLKQLMQGRANKVIAHELGLSARTVEHYRAALMERAGVRTLPELVRIGIAAGL
jgi:two-component system, LuxR family, response regulator FixJ